MNQNVCGSLEFSGGTTLASSLVPDSGTRLSPWKGLARNRETSSLSLVWQKAQLGSSPLLSEGQGKYGS